MLESRVSVGDVDVILLGDGHALVCDGVLGPRVATEVQSAALRLHADGRMHRAGVGAAAARHAEIRGDQICWVDEEAPQDPALTPVLAMFESLRRTLNALAYLGTRALEVQLAVYQSGAGYDAHVDCVRDRQDRRVTAIYYANDWRPGDGGELEVHQPDGVRRIEPIADRLVLFRSDAVLHRVLPVSGPARVSVCAWMRS